VLAVLRGHDGVSAMQLMWGGDEDDVYGGVRAQFIHALVSTSFQVLSETVSYLGGSCRAGDDANAGMIENAANHESGPHAQADHSQAQDRPIRS
jgi:hypothetical protein